MSLGESYVGGGGILMDDGPGLVTPIKQGKTYLKEEESTKDHSQTHGKTESLGDFLLALAMSPECPVGGWVQLVSDVVRAYGREADAQRNDKVKGYLEILTNLLLNLKNQGPKWCLSIIAPAEGTGSVLRSHARWPITSYN